MVVTARWVWIRLGSGDRSRSWSRTILGSLDVSVAALVGKGGSHGEGNTQEGSDCFLFQTLWDITLA
ncbi:hypothetical protein SORBI_3003G176400 [Sorghum bicolor]|uniref:Uncharacterized protein n=1 Tax=Sorghum bicolor TaxID=4558 RepID=A0A1B6Q3W9_SORBI|nr:hypothetical protein SORBI_3003G176400 [Sorghum bicolor]KXG32628.1 hypothetical protein SORBI_3003G176400 [Sorghum bicolor]